MIEMRHILCPVDFSDFSARAVNHALAIAQWYRARVTLLHAHAAVPVAPVAPEMLPPMALSPEEHRELQTQLAQLVGPWASDVDVAFEVVEGHAPSEILDLAESLPADLLVLGTHGRSGFERLLLGSVTEKLLRKSPCPVLSVPRDMSGALPAPPLFKRILCAVDFSACSLRALDYALSLAQEADACLTILHVFDLEGAMPEEWRDRLSPPSLRKEVDLLESARRERLEALVPENATTYCTVNTAMVSGVPSGEIVKAATHDASDVIVIGVQGRNAADLLFFGSTTNRVLREATCPVLTIRAHAA